MSVRETVLAARVARRCCGSRRWWRAIRPLRRQTNWTRQAGRRRVGQRGHREGLDDVAGLPCEERQAQACRRRRQCRGSVAGGRAIVIARHNRADPLHRACVHRSTGPRPRFVEREADRPWCVHARPRQRLGGSIRLPAAVRCRGREASAGLCRSPPLPQVGDRADGRTVMIGLAATVADACGAGVIAGGRSIPTACRSHSATTARSSDRAASTSSPAKVPGPRPSRRGCSRAAVAHLEPGIASTARCPHLDESLDISLLAPCCPRSHADGSGGRRAAAGGSPRAG
jgi:hypothetical protein